MRIPQIQITTTKGVIGIETKRAQLSIDQPHEPVLNLKTNHVKVEIDSEAPRITIDQSQCFAESGLKKPIALSEDNAAYCRQKMLESIGKIADQGNQMMAIENPGSPIAEIGHYNAYDQFVREWNMVTMPQSRPRIDFIEGTVDIQIRGGTVENNTRYQKPLYQYSPPNISIYLKQQPSIHFSVKA